MTDQTRSGINEAWGILLLAFCLLVSLGLVSYDWRDISLLMVPPNEPRLNFIGPAGAWCAFVLLQTLGLAAYLVPLWLLFFGLILLLRQDRLLYKTIWAVVLTLSVTCLLDLQRDLWQPVCERLNLQSASGGVLAQAFVHWLSVNAMGTVGATILIAGVFCCALVMFVGAEPVRRLMSRAALSALAAWQESLRRVGQWRESRVQVPEKEEDRRREPVRPRPRTELPLKEEPPRPVVETARAPAPVAALPIENPVAPRPAAPVAAEATPAAAPPAPKKAEPPQPPGAYQRPGPELLDDMPPARERAIKGDIQTTGRVIQETLAEFGIETEITNVEQGPVVTRYELRPAPGVRVERISNLGNNLSLSLKATSVRVQAPIPGKGVVGIEVPNSIASMVYLREMLEGETWRNGKAWLPLALGKDIGGADIVADLAAMPHLLIAGATGSGKTVCINSILAGLLIARTPAELRLMLIDPKIVEFAGYNHLPHLVSPVITDARKVAIGLRWAITEMEKRYKLFAKAGVRNISSYNSRPVEKQEELFNDMPAGEEEIPEGPLPYIVIVIDELADLMLTAQAEIETSIARLAQLSRAVGIHMILATQRPSVNVITGTIKANFPTRIAFQVASQVDSRTILDANGAEKLLGRGDMLFLPPGSSKLVRAQGVMTTDAEINRVVDFIKSHSQANYESSIREKIEAKGGDVETDDDDEEMVEMAVQIIKETHRASTSSLQRRLRIGYTRAARIMDLLEERGIVGPPRGSDPREILIDLDGQIPNNAAPSEDAPA